MGGAAMGTIAKYIAVFICGLVVGYVLGASFERISNKEQYTTETVYDTIPYYEPVPVDSFIVRYDVVKLPAVRDTVRDSLIYKDTLVYDSVNVIVPITQKKYQDSTYTAYVSGYKPQLDSISIYRKTVYKTIMEKPGRWGFGLVGGYGYGIKGFTPFVGVAVYYKLLEFKSNEKRKKAEYDNQR